MVDKSRIAGIVNDYLQGSDKFLVGLRISPQNKIMVFIDGDNGVSIADCVALSRHIESLFDRDQDDFELDVSSVGVGSPLSLVRQYVNNKGRLISLLLTDGTKIRGRLAEASDKGIQIEKEIIIKGKKPKNIKTDKDDTVFFAYDDFQEARIMPEY